MKSSYDKAAMKKIIRKIVSLLLCAMLLVPGLASAYKYALDDPMSEYLYYVNAPSAENTSGEEVSTWGLPEESYISVNAGDAWGRLTGSEDEIVVAVVDSGVNVNHEDLKNVLWTNPGNIGLPGEHGFNFSDNKSDLTDTLGHGTHCAGIIAAEANNGTGIAGVASGAKVKIMMLGTNSASPFEENGGETNDEYRELGALEYILQAKRSGVNIVAVSNSWCSPGFSEIYDDIFNELGEEGILCFVAAGNETIDMDYHEYTPGGGSSPYRVTVGAVNEFGAKAGFSNYGRSIVDLFTPGTNILSTVSYPCYFPEIYSAEKRNETTAYYGLFDGNSVIENGSVTPSVGDCGEGVKPFGASVFHIQKADYVAENEDGEGDAEEAAPEAEPATIEFSLVQDHYFTGSGNPGALRVTIHNVKPGEEYYLYFPYEKDPATTGSDNTWYSEYMVRDYEEGDLEAMITLGEVIADKDGNCTFTGGGYAETELKARNKDLGVHAGNHMMQKTCLASAEEVADGTAGIGICISPSFPEDGAESGDVHFYLNSIAVSKPGAVISADEAYDIMQGTSMACPCAAGAYAVLASLYPRQEGQSGAEYALEMKARLFACVRQTEELKDECVTGGILDLSLVGLENPVLMRAECDPENETLVLSGENLNGDYILSFRRPESEDPQAVTELPADGMTAEASPDGKSIVIRNAKALFSTYTEFALSDSTGVRTKICDFLVKGQKCPEKILEEAYPQTIGNSYFILPNRSILTDEAGETLYGYELNSGTLSVFDGRQFSNVWGTDLKEAVVSWLREQGINDYILRHNLSVELQDLRNPIYTGNTLYHPVKVEIKPSSEAEYEDYTIRWLLASLDYTDPDPAWTFLETKQLSELFGMYSVGNLGFAGMDGKIYVLGSEWFEEEAGKVPEPFMFSYEIASRTWTREEALPRQKSELQLRAKNGKLYAACGLLERDSEGNDIQEASYEIACFENGAWKQLADLPYIGNNSEEKGEDTLNRVKGTCAATDDGLVFFNCPTEGGGNVFLYRADTGACEPLYYTFNGFKADTVQLCSAVETKDGIYYFEENMDGYMYRYNLYRIPN